MNNWDDFICIIPFESVILCDNSNGGPITRGINIYGVASHRYYFGDSNNHTSDFSVCNINSYQVVYVNIQKYNGWITKIITQVENIGKIIKPCQNFSIVLTILTYIIL